MAENITHVKFVDLNKTIQKIIDRTERKYKKTSAKIGHEVLKSMFGAIVEDTPVNDADPSDMGTTKANWQISKGSPATGVLADRKPNRTRRNIKVPRSFKQLFGHKWFFSNNVPWINFLEFGGYPTSPKRGTWSKSLGRYEIRSQGGFSLQAPQGMFRKNIERYSQFVAVAVAKFGNK